LAITGFDFLVINQGLATPQQPLTPFDLKQTLEYTLAAQAMIK